MFYKNEPLQVIGYSCDDEDEMIVEETLTNLNEKLRCKNRIKRLEQELSKYKKTLKIANEMKDIQGSKGNYEYDSYMLGLYNGMEYVISLFEEREPQYIDGHNVKFLNEYGDKYKEANKRAIEYINGATITENTNTYIKNLLKILEGVENE